MFQFLLGFALGNVVGMYLAQTYEDTLIGVCGLFISTVPDLSKKLENFKKDLEAKKKPPSDKS